MHRNLTTSLAVLAGAALCIAGVAVAHAGHDHGKKAATKVEAKKAAAEPAAKKAEGTLVKLAIEGMTCEGCAKRIHAALAKLEGVENARVSYAEKGAEVFLAANGPEAAALVKAVEKSGFKAAVVPATTVVRIDIEGMTCEGCAKKIHAALVRLKGVEHAWVSYDAKGAELRLGPHGPTPETLTRAVAAAGFKATAVNTVTPKGAPAGAEAELTIIEEPAEK